MDSGRFLGEALPQNKVYGPKALGKIMLRISDSSGSHSFASVNAQNSRTLESDPTIQISSSSER